MIKKNREKKEKITKKINIINIKFKMILNRVNYENEEEEIKEDEEANNKPQDKIEKKEKITKKKKDNEKWKNEWIWKIYIC